MLSRALKILLLLTAVIPAAGQTVGGNDATFEVPRTLKGMVIEPSPEACQLGKYVDCPVTHATGALGVEVPLYSWDAGSGHTVDISLSYHTSGVRVEDIGGPAGLGWTLNAGGSISRRIVGLPDEAKGVDHREISSLWDNNNVALSYLKKVYHHETDANYDIYTYNFAGYSGSFVIINGIVRQLPSTDLRIERVDSDEKGKDFMVTAPDGTRYYFTEKEHVKYNLRQYVLENETPHLPDYTGVSTWHLTRIVYPETNETVTFAYKKGHSWTRTRVDNSPAHSYKWWVGGNNFGSDGRPVGGESSSFGSDPSTPTAAHHVTTFEDPKLLSSISSRNAKAVFSYNEYGMPYNSPCEQLSGIKVYSPDGKEIRNIELANGGPKERIRPLLGSVTVKSDTVLLDRREFSYYIPSGPGVGTTADYADYFGFINSCHGHETNVLKPEMEWNPDRFPNFEYTKSFSLKSMTDATGAETRFYYGPCMSSEDLWIGKPNYFKSFGLKVDSIVTTDPITYRKRVRRFNYYDGVSSIELSPSFSDYIAQSGMYVGGTQTQLVTQSAVLTPCSRLPGAPFESAVIYYGTVWEEVDGSDMESAVSTKYEFDTSLTRSEFVTAGRGPSYGDDPNRYIGLRNGTYNGKHSQLYNDHHVSGYHREKYIDRAPLRRVTRYESFDGNTRIAETREIFNSLKDCDTISTGFYCESIVRKIKDAMTIIHEDFQSRSDFNFFDISVTTGRLFRDSVVTTRFYPDGSTRRKVDRYFYEDVSTGNGISADRMCWEKTGAFTVRPETGDTMYVYITVPCPDSIARGRLPLLRDVVTECCGSVLSTHTDYTQNVRSTLCASLRERDVLSWPINTIWKVDGIDSVAQSIGYADFGNGMVLPSTVTLGRPGRRPMDSQRVTGYNSHGKPAGVSTLGKAAVLYTWDAWDNLLSTCVEGTGLLNRYEHLPLVGCTRTELSSGKIRQYSYTGGRLTGISNKFNAPLSQYRYGLYASNKKAGNFVEESVCNSLNGRMVTRRHFDGFGDNYLTYGVGLGGDGETVVSGTKFDAVGRPVRVMVPVTGSHQELDGFPGVIDGDNFDWIFEDLCPEESNATVMSYRVGLPDDRAVVTQSPGDELAGHPARAAFSRCNSVTVAKYKCRRYTVSGNMLRYAGDFDAGVLDVTESIDPDGREMLTFTDFRGFKLLERRVLGGSDFLDTYYINDAWGNPRVVVQPEGSQRLTGVGAGWSLVSEPILNDYAFIYEYDECMRVVSKKLPGCEPVRYCYDRCGQLAFSQDGNQRDEGRRMFYLYDTAGRPTMTGLCDAPSTWAVYTDTAMISSRADNRAIDKTYYSAPVHLGNPKMLNAWYYDTYINLPGHYYDLSVVRNGLLTISSSALMPPVGDQDRIVTSNYYDFDDRLCESTTDIAGGGTINTHTVYTLSDQVDSVWTTTRLPGKTAIVDRYKYRYDHADRLKSVTYYHDGDAPVVLAVNDYDALGRLATAKLPGETVSYAYNVRNALTSITSPRFSQQLRYAAGASNPCYNGNIAEAVTQGNKYAYTYDNANRLTAAKYTPSAGNADYSATYAYDRNSNITALTRKGLTGRLGTFGTVDDLTLTYDGNQLSKVTETADEVLLETSRDIRPATITRPTVSQFSYDANGNTTMDHPRSISSITYNPLNLPQSVSIENSPNNLISNPANRKYISYTYDASGVKHRVIHSSTKPDVSPTGRLTTADTTDYVGNRVYLNGKLDKVLTPYGYLQGGKFHTWLHDYQGNIVAVVVGDSVAQHNSYYPYGLPHATLSIRTNVTTNTPNTYKYSGKEFDTFGGTDLYDFHARYHAPSTGRFMTVDQLCEEKLHLSGYAYCAGNPINLVDPSGMNEVNVDYKTGRVKDFIKSKERDIVNITTNDGDVIKSCSLDSNGVISNVTTETASNGVQYDLYEISGDENATKVFEFLADSFYQEFSVTKTTTPTEPEKDYITTSGHSDMELGIGVLSEHFTMGQVVREWTHNHPGGLTYPSGFTSKTEDIMQSLQFEHSLFPQYQSRIYLPKHIHCKSNYITYTSQSTYKDLKISFFTPYKTK